MAMPAMVGHGFGAGMGGGIAGGVLGGILGGVPSAAPAPGARVRSYFPEALYINPEIVTDASGSATISIPLADSITTWRMAMLASTARGALGSGTSSIKVFQDFFTDLDLPVTLTQGDRVSIPVAVYNYSPARGDVNLRLQTEDWFSLAGDSSEKTVSVDSNRVGGSQFTIEAKRIGKFKLTLFAKMGGGANRADIIVREIEIVPNGREQTEVFNGRLETSVEHAIAFPAEAIPEASKIYVRLYPGPLSQVIEGMDSILRMPGGCFEQTSSSTYPNTLALDYMKRTKKLTPEIHAKAEGFIASGYQRLLTFEVPGGGFSWFGNAPANKILTAYGLMEFADMAKVYDVDPRVISVPNTGSPRNSSPTEAGSPTPTSSTKGRPTAITRMLCALPLTSRGRSKAAAIAGRRSRRRRASSNRNWVKRIRSSTLIHWRCWRISRPITPKTASLRIARRRCCLTRFRRRTIKPGGCRRRHRCMPPDRAPPSRPPVSPCKLCSKRTKVPRPRAKRWRISPSKKDASGAWGSTQATIMALRAILLSTEKGAADTRGTVEITLNGRPVQSLTLTADNNDLLHQFVLPSDAKGANTVALRFSGQGGLAYQVAGKYFLPWDARPAHEPLSITVDYDRARLAQDDLATATATVRNNMMKVREHGDGGSRHPARLRSARRRLARWWPRAEGEPHPHAGDSVLRFPRRRRNGGAEIPIAGEVSHPRANVRLADL